VILGLGLFAYFAITTGLGIFWVARQELPVFDLHYLFATSRSRSSSCMSG